MSENGKKKNIYLLLEPAWRVGDNRHFVPPIKRIVKFVLKKYLERELNIVFP